MKNLKITVALVFTVLFLSACSSSDEFESKEVPIDNEVSNDNEVLIDEDLPFVLEDPVITFDTNNSNAIRAEVSFAVKTAKGDSVDTHAITYWRKKGDVDWNYKHDSSTFFPSHVQQIPRGTVNSGANGPYLIAGEEYEYYIEATDGTTTVSNLNQELSFIVPANDTDSAFSWSNNETPPTLMNVKTFRGVNSLTTAQWNGDNFQCAGPYYRISGSTTEDAFIDMRGETLTMPLWIQGFRSVILVGGTFNIGLTPGCGIGEKRMFYQGRGVNLPSVHPHTPTGRIIYSDATDITWIEGVNAQANGNATDFAVTNGSLKNTMEYSRANRKVYFINTRAAGWEGVTGPEGQGFHGDFVQNQQLRLGRDAETYRRSVHTVVMENVTSLTGMSHMSLGQDDPFTKISLRNVYFDMDPIIGADQNGNRGPEGSSDTSPDEQKGPMLYCRLTDYNNLLIDNVYYRNQRYSSQSDRYAIIMSDRTGSSRYAYASKFADGSPTGLPNSEWSDSMRLIPGDCYDYMTGNYPSPVAAYDFAPDDHTGRNYVSPWAATYLQY